MVNINGEKVTLRAVEPADIDALYQWENQTDLWHISGTASPFSHHTLSMFIEAQRQDIFLSRQMRLMICRREDLEAVGALDIFEFDVLNQRAGVGIMVAGAFQRCGYGADALAAVERYAADFLRIHQLWCNVEEDNLASLSLFTSSGYKEVGRKEDWNATASGFKAEIMLQKIL
ncbi:MAG: GNAT family N-acetyltransferase [Rikenellaceae bacterium]